MSGRSWTELFFLDEATAFAAGHRPCFYCRRVDAVKFRDAWAKGNRSGRVSAKEMDATLHAERLDGRVKRLHQLRGPVPELPDGAMVAAGEQSYLVRDGETWLWSFAGYSRVSLNEQLVKLLTPPSTLRAFRAGYRPAFDPDAIDSNKIERSSA